MFLPGAHTLDKSIYFYTSGNHSLTIAALDETCSLEDLKVNISCEKDTNIRLEDFGEVSLACLNLYSCLLVCHSSSLLSVDQVFVHGGYLRANATEPSFTNMMVGPVVENTRNGQLRMRFCESGTVTNVLFAHNNLPDTISNGVLHVHNSNNIAISNCTLFDNANPLESRGVIHLHGSRNITFSDCEIYNNRKTALYAIDSTFRLSVNVSFINNTGYDGGAISLFSSYLTVSSNAMLLFERNHAENVGGGIFSSNTNGPLVGGGTCVMTIDSKDMQTLPRIVFLNNTAVGSGSAMHGIVMSQLLCDYAEGGLIPIDTIPKIFSIFPDDKLAISSDPERVCFCPEKTTPDCLLIVPEHHPSLQYTVYPGQKFNVSAVVVGPNFASAKGSVFSRFFNSREDRFSLSSSVKEVFSSGCSDLEYSVSSQSGFEIIIFTIDGREYVTPSVDRRISVQNTNSLEEYYSNRFSNNPDRYYLNGTFRTDLIDSTFELAGNIVHSLQTAPVFISVTLLDCPPGFILSGDPEQCTCDPVLLENNVTCNIDDQTFRRYGTIWVNKSFDGNESGVIVHRLCPFDYCRPEAVDVNLTQPDTQCAFNRSGTLCGACKPGLSLALGSPQCLQCSNRNISLLIVFALAGIALVFLIKVFNLTVAEGTINGLIFYANIVKANEALLFPATHARSILYVFVSWFNLDFGIESCFFDGLNGYWKSWLQFAFPFYVWLIAILIIVVSHYSATATKIFGNNSVPVLATLFLLSYAKLLRNLINIFSFSLIPYPTGSTTAVWALDGNISYMDLRHGFLFFFSLAVLLLLILPYIVILLSAGGLRKHLHRRGLKWLVPFFDANFGPLKDKHCHWVGVLLLVRAVLFVLFAIFLNSKSNVNILLIAVASACLIYTSLFGRFYKKRYLAFLENSFFLNLVVLAVGTLYVKVAGGNQLALIIVSLVVVALQFIAILVFHSYYFIVLEIQRRYKLYTRNQMVAKKTRSSEEDNDAYDPVLIHTATVQDIIADNNTSISGEQSFRFSARDGRDLQMINFTELREPLLESVTS